MIVIWNSRSGVPVRTIFGAHPGGVLSLDMTHDAMFIATLGAGADQSLKIWEWTIKASKLPPWHNIALPCRKFYRDSNVARHLEQDDFCHAHQTSTKIRCGAVVQADVPVAESEITSRDVQHCVAFRRDDTSELVTNGSARTIFWTWYQSTCISFFVFVQQERGPGHRIANPPLAEPLARQDGKGAQILLASDFSEGVPDTHRKIYEVLRVVSSILYVRFSPAYAPSGRSLICRNTARKSASVEIQHEA